MPFTESLTAFFDTDEFATAATYAPAVGDSSTIKGVFDREYVEVGRVNTQAPTFRCEAIDDVAIGDQLTIAGATYDIISLLHDASRLVDLLVLQDAA